MKKLKICYRFQKTQSKQVLAPIDIGEHLKGGSLQSPNEICIFISDFVLGPLDISFLLKYKFVSRSFWFLWATARGRGISLFTESFSPQDNFEISFLELLAEVK